MASMAGPKLLGAPMAVVASFLFQIVVAIPALEHRQDSNNPFAPIDPQNWVSKRIHHISQDIL